MEDTQSIRRVGVQQSRVPLLKEGDWTAVRNMRLVQVNL